MAWPNDQEVARIIDACEARLQDHAKELEFGRQGADEFVVRTETAKDAAIAKKDAAIAKDKTGIVNDLKQTAEVIAAKKEQFEKATATVNAAYSQLVTSIQQHIEKMELIYPAYVEAESKVEQAKLELSREESKNSKDRDERRFRDALKDAERRRDRLKSAFEAAQYKRDNLISQFNEKHASEFAIIGMNPSEIEKKLAKQRKNEKKQARLLKKEKEINAPVIYKFTDFIRPRFDQILADVVPKPEPPN
jgi:hypothetical protein